jgi:hypothetical protein
MPHLSTWGWSWGDMAANLFGSGLFISQQVDGKSNVFNLNFRFTARLIQIQCFNERSDDLFGSGWAEANVEGL